MEAVLETLNADRVREPVREIIGLEDQYLLGMLRSRACEQDVLDILDDPAPR